jgi:hypothetical protein
VQVGEVIRDLWDYFYELGWRMFAWAFWILLPLLAGVSSAQDGHWLMALALVGLAIALPAIWSWIFYFRPRSQRARQEL